MIFFYTGLIALHSEIGLSVKDACDVAFELGYSDLEGLILLPIPFVTVFTS